MCGWTRSGSIPEDKGRLVTAFLESFFKRYVEYDFTADLEEKLDLVSAGKLDWKDVLRDFWRDFIGAVNDIGDLRITQVLDALNDMLGPHIFPDQGTTAATRAPARPAMPGVSASRSASSAPSSAAPTIPNAASPASSPTPATRRPRLPKARSSAPIPRPGLT